MQKLSTNAANYTVSNQCSKESFRLKPLAYAVISIMVAGSVFTSAQATDLNITKHWVRDYLDLAQNKGVFERGATGVQIVRKDGSVFKLPDVPIPDFSVVSNHGPATSIGGAYIVTATHNSAKGDWVWPVKNPVFGNTKYSVQGHEKGGSDFSALRLDKFVVETTGVQHGIDRSLNEAQFVERYGVEYNGKKQVIAYRAGQGVFKLIDQSGRTEYAGVTYKPELLSGSLFTMMNFGGGSDVIDFKNFTSFFNGTTGGDSGSSVFVWDTKNKEWVVAGVLTGIKWSSATGDFYYYSKWNQNVVDKLKDKFTHKVALDNGTLTFNGNKQYQINGGNAQQFADKKDLSFTGGGTIDLKQNMHLGVGGLIFDANKTYTVNGKEYSYKGAGIDIGKGTTVHWNVKGDASDNLHKIGEGTLEVNVAQGNNMKIGNGTAILKAENSFNNVYLTNGLATVKLDNAKALNNTGNFGGVFFDRYGGTLDLNGYSQTFKRIAASDDGAIVANYNKNQRADVNFELPWQYAYHGQFKGNLNVKHEFEQKLEAGKDLNTRHLILDGGMEIEGDISVKNAKLTMQSLPTSHASFGKPGCQLYPIICDKDWTKPIKDKEQAVNDKYGTHYKSDNTTSSLKQPDWEARTYKFDTLKLDNATLGVGRDTTVLGDIVAKDSKVQFGGDVATYRDQFAGKNVTGFDFRQELHSGSAEFNPSIYFDGNITASNSTFISYMPMFSASFELKDGSKFESKDKYSVTRLLDKGIKVEGKSTLILGDVFAHSNPTPVTISKSDDSTISIENVSVFNTSLTLPGDVVKGSLRAYHDGKIFVDQWELKNNNLATAGNGIINIGRLNTVGTQAANANVSISGILNMTDLNPNQRGAGAKEWIGLSLNELTLQKDSKITAAFSNDYLSVNNLKFDGEHTLISTNKLTDERTDKNIKFTTQGHDVAVKSTITDKEITFAFEDKRPQTQAQGYSLFRMMSDRLLDEGDDYFEIEPSATMNILAAIESHQKSGGASYQEVAISDALSMEDTQESVKAINAIVKRTDNMLEQTAKTISQDKMVQPIRTAIDTRLASLRRSARSATASYHPVAAIGDFASMAKATEEQRLNNSFFVDVSGGYQKNDSRKEHVLSTNLGFDNVMSIENGRMVLGGALSLTKVDNSDTGMSDDGMMYSLTGYLSYEQKQGFELQSYLTAGYLVNDRSMMPEINLGEQTFDERSWMLMSSNYFKYHFRAGNLSIRPMAIVDLGWSEISESESTYFKRDNLTERTVDLGLGVEIEGSHESIGYLFQVTARRNVYNSADSIGVNLKNAQGYISYDLENRHETTFGANAMVSKRIMQNMILDVGAGATASTDGSLGVNGNARLRYLF